MERLTRWRAIALMTSVVLATAACSGTASTSPPGGDASLAPADTSIPTEPYTLKIAYSANYEFDTPELATKWWTQLEADYKAKHPNATIEHLPIQGNYVDLVNKLSLMFRSPDTAPDIAEVPNELISAWAQSGYLLPIESYVEKTSWWPEFPDVVKGEDTYDGHVYAVSHGENTNALLYRKDMFEKAGIALPWNPKTWQDIIDAAKQIQSAIPGVSPLWLNAGTTEGANVLAKGINNFLAGTKDPTIQDPETQKFVVDSPGIRDALGFYQQAFSLGLTPPVSTLFGPSAVTMPVTEFSKGTVAIAVGCNFYGGNWTEFVDAPFWAEAPQLIGMAILPSNYDPSRPASTLGGLGLAVGANTKSPQAAFDFLEIAQTEKNIIDAGNWGGWIPPQQRTWTEPGYTDFAAPFNAFFATILPYAIPAPASADYAVWAEGMGRATGAFAQNPSTTVDQAVEILKTYVTQQLGADRVEVRK